MISRPSTSTDLRGGTVVFFGLLAMLGIVLCGIAIGRSRDDAERFDSVVRAIGNSRDNLQQAGAAAREYARSGSAPAGQRAALAAGAGANDLTFVQTAAAESGPIQAECRQAMQSYELAGAQIVLALEARKKERVARAKEILASQTASDALQDCQSTMATMSRQATEQADSYRRRAQKATAAAIVCALGLLFLAARVWKARSRRKNHRTAP